MDLSIQDIARLAECERDMDSGKQAFVVCEGSRWAFSQSVLDLCGVQSG